MLGSMLGYPNLGKVPHPFYQYQATGITFMLRTMDDDRPYSTPRPRKEPNNVPVDALGGVGSSLAVRIVPNPPGERYQFRVPLINSIVPLSR